MPLISLTSDFGLQDHFAGVMHAVILGICPHAQLIDLTHLVPRHDIVAGAWQLASAWAWFPPGSIHLAVVDPGVGSERRALIAQCGDQHFVAPDNGLLDLVFRQHAPEVLVAIDASAVCQGTLSRSFHGRDVFAPAAALLAAGRAPTELGTPTSHWCRLDLPPPHRDGDCLIGHVIAIDGFGNCATNIPNELLPEPCRIQCQETTIEGLSSSYASVPPGRALALPGSNGYLELSVNQGHAAEQLGIGIGSSTRVAPC